MNIGIIGAGHIGGTLTRRLTALGHDVAVANSRGPESLAGLAGETGARPVSVTEAVIHAKHLLERGRPAGEAGRIALPVSGDDDAAKAVVLRLIDELGFYPRTIAGPRNDAGSCHSSPLSFRAQRGILGLLIEGPLYRDAKDSSLRSE